MEKEKVERINELGRLMKTRPLTEEEKAEQAALRAEYLAWFRAAIRGEEKNNIARRTEAAGQKGEKK